MMYMIDSPERSPAQREAPTKDSFSSYLLPVIWEHKTVRRELGHEELLHWHEGVELIRIRRGNVHCHVNDIDFLLNPGELCFINFDTMHRVYNTEMTAVELDVLTIQTDRLAQDKAIYQKYILPILRNPDFSHVRMDGKNSYARLISDLFDSLEETLIRQDAGYELDVMGYIYMIFRRLYLVYASQKDKAVPGSMDVLLQRKMTRFIYEHYPEKLSLDDIAGSAGVSRSTCARLFRRYTQKTPIQFLNSYRLEMGSRLLSGSDEPVSYIAGACGIGEQSYFNRLFLKEFGCTPLEWRKIRRLDQGRLET